jgi:hypothetical protein
MPITIMPPIQSTVDNLTFSLTGKNTDLENCCEVQGDSLNYPEQLSLWQQLLDLFGLNIRRGIGDTPSGR